jgi:diguanylate cyclase (GGDEF)-like protein
MIGVQGLLTKGIFSISVIGFISILAAYFTVDIAHNKEIALEFEKINANHQQITQGIIDQSLEKLTLAAEEIYLLGSWQEQSIQTVSPKLELLWPKLELTFDLLSMVVKQGDTEVAFGKVDSKLVDDLYKKTLQNFEPQYQFVCRPTCFLVSTIPITLNNKQAAFFISAGIASSIYDIYTVSRSEITILEAISTIDPASPLVELNDRQYSTSLQTSQSYTSALFNHLNGLEFAQGTLQKGVQLSAGNEQIYAWLHTVENETDALRIIFIRNVDDLLQKREELKTKLLTIIGTITFSTLVIVSLLGFGPIKRLGKLKRTMALIGHNQYSEAIAALGKVKTGRKRDEIDALEREFKFSIGQLANYEKQLEESRQGLRRMATIDTTTGLLNRNAFLEDMEALADKLVLQKASLLFIDLDSFKHVNDNLGHIVGDLLLEQVGSRLKPLSTDTIKAYRIGGDEFLIAVANHLHVKDLGAFAELINQQFDTSFIVQGKNISITASVGVASATQQTHSHIDLLKHADIAMYRAKELGKNTYCFFNDQMLEQVNLHYIIENEFINAIKTKQVSLVFQPIIDIKNGKLVKLEALSRWIHPELGFIRPDLFISVLEETGQINTMSQWLISQATLQVMELDAAGLSDVVVSINISGAQVTDIDSINQFMVECSKTKTEYNRLELEITETSLISDFSKAQDWITKVNKMGFRIAIDDFGTGYSSLSYLTSFPFDCVKLDRSLLLDVEENERTRNIVGSITDMIHALGVPVVAEGIETQSHLAAIKRLNCDYVQGYFYSRPLSAPDLKKNLARYIENGHWIPAD